MIEHLTASLKDQTTAVDSRASTLRDEWVARMVQFGAVPILIAATLNIVEFHQATGLRWSWALGCAWFNFLVSASALSLTFTRSFTRNWRPVAFLLLSLLVGSNTVLGTLGDEPILLLVSSILLMVGTGSILPWSLRFQVSFNLVCLISWAIEGVWSRSTDATALYKVVGVLTAAAMSYFTCYLRDRFVREHEESERSVRESERALRQIFDANTDSIMLIDFETSHILDVNEQFVRLSGFRRDEVVGKTTIEINLWTDPALKKEFIRLIRKDHCVKNMEVSFRIRDGKIIPCLLSSVIIMLHGRPCVMTLTRDVTELRESQEKLRDSEEKFRLIFEASRDCIMVSRASDTRVSDVNNQFIKLSGFTREEVIGSTALELGMWSVPEDRLAVVKGLTEHGYVDGLETVTRTRAGAFVPVQVSVVAVKLAGEDYYIAVGRDISAIKEAEQKIRDSEATLRKIFDAGVDWMSIIDMATGNYLDVNESFVRATGHQREDLIGSNFVKLGLWPDDKEWQPFTEKLISTGEVRNQRATFRKKDGTLMPCLVSAVKCELWGKLCCISTARDISDLNEAQEKLQRSEETFREVFDSSLDALSITDASTGEYLDVNPEFLLASGFSRAEVVGVTTDALGLWADPDKRQIFRRVLKETGEVRNLQTDIRTKDGRIVPCLTSGVLADIGGRLCCLRITRDISEIKAAEQKLRKSGETFGKIFDTSLDAMSITDATTGEYLDVNPEFLRVSGFSCEEIRGTCGNALGLWVNPDQRELFRRVLSEKGEVRNMETECRRKDGSTISCLTSGVLAEIGGRVCCLGVTRDISELKEAEENLRKSETMLRAIFDNSLDGISLLDSSTQTVIEVNAEQARIIGFSREEMIGKSFDELVPPADPVRQQELAVSLLQGREVRNFEITFATRYGRNFPALVSAAIVVIDGRPHTLAVARDITDLVKAREAALAASRAKSEFLSIMSHEIRTPMNAILGMADLMGESDLNSEQRRYLDTILSNGNALLALINSILDLAKVESGRLSLETVEFDVIELTERAADTLAVRAHEKGVELAVRFAPDLPSLLTGDPHRLRQVVTNLIGNAIKFTKQGEVVVKVRRNPDREVPGNLRFEVYDTGIGIAPDKIESIFSIFTQADTSTTRKFGGSGLGLAIVQRLVALMGGRVWVESDVGKGSTFFFTVDLRVPEAACALDQLPIEPALHGVRTLVVTDHATTLTVVAEALRAQGAEVTETASQAEARAAATSANRQGVRFELLLVDGEMKSSDGYEALPGLRAIEPNAAVVMLTKSNGLPAKLRRMRAQGVHHYSTKPIKRQELYAVIAEARSKSAPPRMLPQPPRVTPATVAAPAAIADRPLKILLADDSPDNRLLIRAYMKKSRYLLTEAEDGQIAVDRFMDGEYDLVLMDIQMPVLDGYSAVRAIRQWEHEHGRAHTPILALTASALEEDVRRAKEAGCDMHVSKPVKKSTLLDAISHAIEATAQAAPIGEIDGNGTTPTAAVAPCVDPAAFSSDFHI